MTLGDQTLELLDSAQKRACVTGYATIAGGLVGGFIGTKVFSKHFAKLGM